LYLSVNIHNIEQELVSELKISTEEAKVFVSIVEYGRMDPKKISNLLGYSVQDAKEIAESLLNKGMIINFTRTEYESLHPRFAITNRYKKRCQEDNIAFKKNLKVDNIGKFLEGSYDHARTK
jgi:sugar-specific transcriptional regulator TrmB